MPASHRHLNLNRGCSRAHQSYSIPKYSPRLDVSAAVRLSRGPSNIREDAPCERASSTCPSSSEPRPTYFFLFFVSRSFPRLVLLGIYRRESGLVDNPTDPSHPTTNKVARHRSCRLRHRPRHFQYSLSANGGFIHPNCPPFALILNESNISIFLSSLVSLRATKTKQPPSIDQQIEQSKHTAHELSHPIYRHHPSIHSHLEPARRLGPCLCVVQCAATTPSAPAHPSHASQASWIPWSGADSATPISRDICLAHLPTADHLCSLRVHCFLLFQIAS